MILDKRTPYTAVKGRPPSPYATPTVPRQRHPPTAEQDKGKPKTGKTDQGGTHKVVAVEVSDLIAAGLINPTLELEKHYKGAIHSGE